MLLVLCPAHLVLLVAHWPRLGVVCGDECAGGVGAGGDGDRRQCGCRRPLRRFVSCVLSLATP